MALQERQAMLPEQQLVVDYRQKNEISQILPHPPLYKSNGWQGIEMQYHRQPPIEMPQHRSSQHIIAIHHDPHLVERSLDGRKQLERTNARDIVIVPANVSHGSKCEDGISSFSLLLLEVKHLAQMAHESIDADLVELVPTFAKPDPVIYRIGSLLQAELASDERNSTLYVDGLTTALSAHVLHKYCTVKQSLQNYSKGLPKNKKQHAIDYIQAHLDEKLSLETIATQLNMSVYYFCELFTQSMGIPPYKYVLQQRVERAKQLLKQSEKSLTEIAFECGFAHQSHLNRHFRKLTGVTPKRYRDR